jgi:hypothetical protein
MKDGKIGNGGERTGVGAGLGKVGNRSAVGLSKNDGRLMNGKGGGERMCGKEC